MSLINKKGDFSGLAKDYSNNEPNYSFSVLKALFGLLDKKNQNVDMVDVGAGTGIWSRMAYELGIKSLICIEPNDDMRNMGIKDSEKNEYNLENQELQKKQD